MQRITLCIHGSYNVNLPRSSRALLAAIQTPVRFITAFRQTLSARRRQEHSVFVKNFKLFLAKPGRASKTQPVRKYPQVVS